MQFNLADIFESVVDVIGDREALIADGRRLTYAELDARANQLAHHLTAQGVGVGDHVGCHLKNGTEYLEAMIACFKIRAVPINVNFRYVEEELRYLCADADLVAAISDVEFIHRLQGVRGQLPLLRHVIVVGDEGKVPDDCIGYEAAIAEQPTGREALPTDRSPDDLMMIYTGGTTGMPKGVMWRHEDIFFAGMLGARVGGPGPVESPEEVAPRALSTGGFVRTFPAAPLMHGAAELASFITFWSGGTVILIRDFSGHGACKLIEQEKPISISLVGDAMATPLLDAIEEGDYDLSSLMSIGSAGAILSGSTRERAKSLISPLEISDAFGASEVGYTGSATADSSPEKGLKFEPRETAAVVSDDGKILPHGSDEIGRVAHTGNIPLGYYKDEKKTAETFVMIDGTRWVVLGDRAKVDADGVIHFLGRGSVCINSGGEKIFPEEVESALKAHDDIVDAVVAGIPDAKWGAKAVAVIRVKDGREAPTQADIEQFLSTRIARYKVPRLMVVVEEMVRSPSGKPDYKWARRTAAEFAGVAI